MDAMDDGGDICPVCDGECTCRPNISIPSLKIKLTLPPSMRQPPRKRGRPPKQRPQKRPPPPPPPQLTKTKKNKSKLLVKRGRRQQPSSGSSSELTDLSHDNGPVFPTFVPAEDVNIPMSSHSSSDQDDDDDEENDSTDSDESTSSDDSEIQAEEERFLRNDWHIKSRNHSPESHHIAHDSGDDEVDDDDLEDDVDELIDDADDDLHDENASDSFVPTTRGLATGWSDDEESSFDADLFFANLDASDSSDNDSIRASSPSPCEPPIQVERRPPTPERHTFDIAEDWTGAVIFTNGFDSHSLMMEMELDADDEDEGDTSSSSSTFSVRHSSPSHRHSSPSMFDLDDELEGHLTDGDSTDQELVGADGLPTSRLMSLFRMPSSVGAVNPQSTSKRNLAEEDEMDIEMDVQGRGKIPLMGRFVDSSIGKERVRGRERITIISRDTSHDAIPSPFGRRRVIKFDESITTPSLTQYRTRSTSLSSTTSSTSIDYSSFSSDPSTPKPLSFAIASQLSSALSSLATVNENEVDIADLLSPEFLSGSSGRHIPTLAELAASPSPAGAVGGPSSSSTSAIDAMSADVDEELKNLHRWDLISVGAYRRTRHKDSDNHDAAAAAAAIQQSPMASFGAAMFYPSSSSSPSKDKNKRRSGDKTPTLRTRPHIPPFHLPPPPHHQNLNKELNKGKARRKEREMGAVHHRHQNNNHHYYRSHFPNSRRRSMGGVQRSSGGQSSPLMSGI